MFVRRFSVLGAAAMAVCAPAGAIAQDESVSREVVQAMPAPEVTALNHALKRLAINGRNLDALLDAGNAALALGDADAALGFFGRGLEVSPDNAQVNLGMARVFMQSERPIEALSYFARAEQGGAPAAAIMSDRGLAYDLLGENEKAQECYQEALAGGPDAEVTRRLALSYAISGDRDAFNKTLLPMISEKDIAAYRTRAFGLAILGELNEAKGLVTTVIPRDLASRIIPYLEFMPRLTKAQQAAAANLGRFPKAAEIGREDPAIVAFREDLRSPKPTAKTASPMTEAPAEKVPTISDPKTERHWVQLAAGRNRSALRGDWVRFSRRAPSQLQGLQPHVIKIGRLHRLLAGPVANRAEATALVGALARERVDSFAITTNPGAKVEKLQ